MTPESSPFNPGQPAPVEFFVGQRPEIERLRGMAAASAQGRFRIGFVSGERGIGKSSLAAFARRLVESRHDALGCHVFLGGVQDLGEMLRRTFAGILKENVDKPWREKVMDFFGDRVRKVGLFGLTLDLDLQSRDLSSMEHDFAPSIRRLLDSLGEPRRSLFLVLDDINGLADSGRFAQWLKSTVDEIAVSREETRICMLMVGLEARRRALVTSQPSLARVFELIDISPWSDDEVLEFYRNAFDKGQATIAEQSLQGLVSFTGGLPVLAHEIGDAVWRTAQSPEISDKDIAAGIFTAAQVIGQKWLEPQSLQAIRSERYHSILRTLADQPQMRFQRADLLKRTSGAEQRAVDNFLHRMKKLGALAPDPGIRGGYRFPNMLHALYFWMAARIDPPPMTGERR